MTSIVARKMSSFASYMQKWLVWENRLSTAACVAVIVTLSLVVKLGYIILLSGGLATFPSEGTDASFYYTAGMSLLTTGVYGNEPGRPTVGMPPGQSFFLALLYAVSNNSIGFAKLTHVVLLTAVAVLTYLAGKQVAIASVGFWGGVLTAIDPAQAYLSGTFLSEPLFIFLATAAIYLLVRQQSRTSLATLVFAGICLGLAGLTRNQGWLFAVALWAGAVITQGRVMTIRAATVTLLVTFAMIAPWTFRNYRLTGQFIPVSVEGGLTLWASNNPEFIFRPPMPMSLPVYDAPSTLAGPQVDQYYRKRAFDWILSHPLDFAINGFRKLLVLYSYDPFSWRPEVSGFFRLAGIFPYGILMPFILIGLILNLRNPRFQIILWYILFSTLLAFLFYGDSRIRAPFQPYLYLFSMLGLGSAVNWTAIRFSVTPSTRTESRTHETVG